MKMDSLLVKYILGELSADELTRVDKWLSENEQNRQHFEAFRKVWETSRLTANRASAITAEDALIRFRQKLKAGDQAVEKKNSIAKASPLGNIHRSSAKWQWPIAAMLTGVLFAGAILIMILHPFKKTEVIAAKRVPPKSVDSSLKDAAELPKSSLLHKDVAENLVRRDILPDKSVITLNRNAHIEYASELTGAQRLVKLTGEAFFAVAHDDSHPFVVQVNDITVKDIGTSFNILGTPGSTEITVESGTVLVTRKNYSLILRAGEKAIEMPDGRLKKETGGDELYGYYLDRPLVCDSMSLLILVKILNKAYDAHITIENKDLNDLRITTTFPAKLPLDRILNVIRETFDISVSRIGNRPLIILK
jgi:transmembrane sensor